MVCIFLHFYFYFIEGFFIYEYCVIRVVMLKEMDIIRQQRRRFYSLSA